jgi:beta-phosphoglucomutase
MKYKAIIFDMDGTIVATEHIWKRVTIELIERRGIIVSQDLAHKLERCLKGIALPQSCQIIKDMTGINDDVRMLIEEKQALAQLHYQEHIYYIPGFEIFHDAIKKLNIPTAIATNATAQTLQTSEAKLHLSKHFGSHMYSVDRVNYKGKPLPDIYLFAAAQLGVKPQDCLVFEDSAFGVQAAKAAGMTCVGINTAHDRTFTQHADIVIDSYDEINISKLFELV